MSGSSHILRVLRRVAGVAHEQVGEQFLGDRAYDSDPLDARLEQQYGIELIAPHKSNRSRPKTQDGRKLRRFCRRWKIERLFAWLQIAT